MRRGHIKTVIGRVSEMFRQQTCSRFHESAKVQRYSDRSSRWRYKLKVGELVLAGRFCRWGWVKIEQCDLVVAWVPRSFAQGCRHPGNRWWFLFRRSEVPRAEDIAGSWDRSVLARKFSVCCIHNGEAPRNFENGGGLEFTLPSLAWGGTCCYVGIGDVDCGKQRRSSERWCGPRGIGGDKDVFERPSQEWLEL
jgi:hypothetical protein